MTKKIKVLTLSDHPLSPSGVGSQTKYVCEALLNSGKFSIISLGGAMKHVDYTPKMVEPYNEDWKIIPVDGYGTPEMIRSVLRTEKVDILWFMTDPRFWGWLWQIENEVRPLCPMVYYHVWDNYPPPKYNGKWYQSTDVIASISKVTYDIVSQVAPNVENHYLPHAVDDKVFKKLTQEDVDNFKEENFPNHASRTIFFWNNRNARRKHSGTLIHWFNKFAEEVGPEKVCLIMHTDPRDPNGQDLQKLLTDFDITDGRIILSSKKMPPEALSYMYNMADCTINISDAEGFGLATLESLSCATPIIVNMTGGLREQVTDGQNWFGIGIEPASKSLIGSQDVPYIYEDRLTEQDFIDALRTIYHMPKKERDHLGNLGLEHVRQNYNYKDFQEKWINLIEDIENRLGSWDTRKNYKSWEIKEAL